MHHRIRRIRIRTSDEEVTKKRKLRNQRENEENEDDDVDRSGNKNGNEGCSYFIKVANIHFNPSSKLAFKSNSFFYNLVLNCNLVRKLIPN